METIHRDDDYMPCSFYEGGTPDENGIYRFERNDKSYFAVMSNGQVLLRSEGYSSEAGRENGIASVLKNIGNDARYATKTLPNGKWVLSLKAANHQEIARSCPMEAEADVRAFLPSARSAAASAVYTSSLVSTWAKSPLYSYELFHAPAVDVQISYSNIYVGSRELDYALLEITRVPGTYKTFNFSREDAERQDDYLPCREYAGRDVNDKINNIAFFKHDNGQYYFALYDENGDVKLRSEGFPTAKERDQELSGALKFINDPEKYEIIQKLGYRMKIVRDATGREVGRSCLEKV